MGDSLIVESILDKENNYDPPDLKVEMYYFYEKDIPTNFNSEILYRKPNDKVTRSYKLVDWTEAKDVLYTIFDFPSSGITYIYNPNNASGDSDINPFIVEYCTYKIQPGSSQRDFSNCLTFNHTRESKYLQSKDLP